MKNQNVKSAIQIILENPCLKIENRKITNKYKKKMKHVWALINLHGGRIPNQLIADVLKITVRHVKRIIHDMKKLGLFSTYFVQKYLKEIIKGKKIFKTLRVIIRQGFECLLPATTEIPIRFEDCQIIKKIRAMMNSKIYSNIIYFGDVSIDIKDMGEPIPFSVKGQYGYR